MRKHRMFSAAVAAGGIASAPGWAWAQQQAEPYGRRYGPHMMDWGGGWYGMIFGPLFMILILALVIADALGSLASGFWFTATAMALSGLWIALAMEETHARLMNPQRDEETAAMGPTG